MQTYLIYRINYYPADFTLSVWKDKFRNDDVVIPPFQRNFRWDITRGSRLIESFLAGLPVPPVFLFREPDGKLVVIDGQQRLKTVVGFFGRIFPESERRFTLTGINEKWEGKDYDALEKDDKRRFDDSVLRAIIIEEKQPGGDSSIFHIFERLNTGGLPLT